MHLLRQSSSLSVVRRQKSSEWKHFAANRKCFPRAWFGLQFAAIVLYRCLSLSRSQKRVVWATQKQTENAQILAGESPVRHLKTRATFCAHPLTSTCRGLGDVCGVSSFVNVLQFSTFWHFLQLYLKTAVRILQKKSLQIVANNLLLQLVLLSFEARTDGVGIGAGALRLTTLLHFPQERKVNSGTRAASS